MLSIFDPARLTATTGALVLATASAGIFLLMQGQLRWELRPYAYALTALAYAVTTLLGTAILILAGAGLVGVFLGQAVGAGVGIALVVLARPAFGWTFSPSWLSRLLTFSLPLVPATLATLGALFVDRFVIGAARSLEDVAVFAVGYRIAAAVGIVMSAVQLALTPLIYAEYRRTEAPREIASAALLVAGGALSIWVMISVLAPEIVGVVGTQAYAESATVIPFLSLAIILAGLVVFAPGLTIERRTRSVAVIALAGLVINLGLGISLVGVFGIVGVAFATLTTAAVVLGLMWWFGRSAYPIPFHGQRLAAAFLASAVAVAASGVVTGDPLSLAARVALALASITCVVILTRAFTLWRILSSGSIAA
jgi:O-antigen/teichoic acid export membrane protein